METRRSDSRRQWWFQSDPDGLLTAEESRARQANAGVERNQQEWCQVRYVYQKAKPLQRA